MSKKDSESVPDKLFYRDGLKDEEKVRYDEKLKLLGGSDPYEITSWSTDVSLLPPVTYIDIVNYLLWTPSVYTKDELKSYKGLEAYNQFVNGWVRDRATVVCNGHTVVTAKVLHSQRLREKPLRPWIIGDKSGQILGAHCTCMAGLGEACTHIAALLFAIDATVRIRDSKTVTDEKAYWLLPSAMKSVEYKKVENIDFTSATTAKRKFNEMLDYVTSPSVNTACVNSPKTPVNKSASVPSTPLSGKVRKEDLVPYSTDDDMDVLYDNLFKAKKKHAILAIVEPYCDSLIPTATTSDFPQVLTDLREDKCYEMNYKELVEYCGKIEIMCSKEQCLAVEFATRNQGKTKLWNTFRAGRITASKMKSVCRTNPASPAPSLIKSICYPDLVKFSNAATTWGCDNEKLARDQFLKAMCSVHENCRVEDVGLYISTKHPYIGASPDGIFTCDCCGTATVEIKCPFSIQDLNTCKYLESVNGELILKKSHEYYYQIQTQLGCCEMERAYFVVWTEKSIHIEEITFNSDLWDHMCERSKDICVSAILPELVGKFFSKIPTDFNKQPLVEKKSNDNIPDNTANSLKKSTNVAGEEVFCYCEQSEHGKMIACDNDQCDIEWFHYSCVKIEKPPRGKWYCPDCRKLPQFKRQRLTRKSNK